MKRIGLYGGTFDPVHHGHLIGAQDALEQMELDEVIFIPCALSPHKVGQESAPAKERLKMLRVATRGMDRFRVSDCEIRRGAPSYTIETVRLFRESQPEDTYFLLIGLDQVEKLSTWKGFAELRQMVTFLVMDRPGNRRPRLPRGVIYLPRPRLIAISSTEIRLRIKNHLMIDHLLPSSVARLIARVCLYEE